MGLFTAAEMEAKGGMQQKSEQMINVQKEKEFRAQLWEHRIVQSSAVTCHGMHPVVSCLGRVVAFVKTTPTGFAVCVQDVSAEGLYTTFEIKTRPLVMAFSNNGQQLAVARYYGRLDIFPFCGTSETLSFKFDAKIVALVWKDDSTLLVAFHNKIVIITPSQKTIQDFPYLFSPLSCIKFMSCSVIVDSPMTAVHRSCFVLDISKEDITTTMNEWDLTNPYAQNPQTGLPVYAQRFCKNLVFMGHTDNNSITLDTQCDSFPIAIHISPSGNSCAVLLKHPQTHAKECWLIHLKTGHIFMHLNAPDYTKIVHLINDHLLFVQTNEHVYFFNTRIHYHKDSFTELPDFNQNMTIQLFTLAHAAGFSYEQSVLMAELANSIV